jgi:uncharacterized alkaline shock family protein YloU
MGIPSGQITVETVRGTIRIAPHVVHTLAYSATMGTYGIVGIASRYTGDDATHTDPRRGIDVEFITGQDVRTHVRIFLHVVVEYGVQLRSVTSRLQHQVAYAVQHSTGYIVDSVYVHVAGLRVTSVADAATNARLADA